MILNRAQCWYCDSSNDDWVIWGELYLKRLDTNEDKQDDLRRFLNDSVAPDKESNPSENLEKDVEIESTSKFNFERVDYGDELSLEYLYIIEDITL